MALEKATLFFHVWNKQTCIEPRAIFNCVCTQYGALTLRVLNMHWQPHLMLLISSVIESDMKGNARVIAGGTNCADPCLKPDEGAVMCPLYRGKEARAATNKVCGAESEACLVSACTLHVLALSEERFGADD